VEQHSILRLKGGGILTATGYIQVHAYTSIAQIPLKDVAVNITDASGGSIAMRLTNRSGSLDLPVQIDTPDIVNGQSPNTGNIPFATVNLYARLKDYEAIEIENLQIFPGTTTVQDLELIPLSELPQSFNKLEIFSIKRLFINYYNEQIERNVCCEKSY
jgi:hypothetical protein